MGRFISDKLCLEFFLKKGIEMVDGYNLRYIFRLEYFMEIGIFIMVIFLKEYVLIICLYK